MSTLLIADDHPLFREALRGVASRLLPDATIHEAENANGLFEMVEAEQDADLLLLDLNMPGVQGFSALVHLRGAYPQLPVVMVSAREEPEVMRRALDHGAVGFIPKSSDAATLASALQQVLDGERWVPEAALAAPPAATDERAVAARVRELTPQQFRVLSLVAEGLLNKQIADRLDIQERTVKAHLSVIFEKLGARNRTQAVLLAGKLALDPDSVVPPDEEAE